MKKGFASIIILLVIAFIILIGGVVVYQKVLAPKTQPTPTPTITPTPSSISQPFLTSDPTANWQTYTNTDTNESFTFKYPANLTFCGNCGIAGPTGKDAASEKIALLRDASTGMPNTGAAFDGFAIYIEQNPAPEITLPEYLAGEKQGLLESYRFRLGEEPVINQGRESKITIGGQPGILLEDYGGDQILRYYLPFPKGKAFLILAKINSTVAFNKVFDQILSTFRFD